MARNFKGSSGVLAIPFFTLALDLPSTLLVLRVSGPNKANAMFFTKICFDLFALYITASKVPFGSQTP